MWAAPALVAFATEAGVFSSLGGDHVRVPGVG
ncbi:MAG: hypothetical protein QG597_5075, partial [Actinomycetota bacterium]|nr:hypothetical protein [Actinomycetota bacterium]